MRVPRCLSVLIEDGIVHAALALAAAYVVFVFEAPVVLVRGRSVVGDLEEVFRGKRACHSAGSRVAAFCLAIIVVMVERFVTVCAESSPQVGVATEVGVAVLLPSVVRSSYEFHGDHIG